MRILRFLKGHTIFSFLLTFRELDRSRITENIVYLGESNLYKTKKTMGPYLDDSMDGHIARVLIVILSGRDRANNHCPLVGSSGVSKCQCAGPSD